MPTPKRVFLIVVRCIPVVVALGFLVFYVGRARIKQSEMLASSKNARVIFSTGPYVLDNPSPKPTSNVPANSAVPPTSALPPPSSPTTSQLAPSVSSDAGKDGEASSDPFRIGVFPARPVTLSGSKSMSRPVVEASELLRLLHLPSNTTYHTYGLPALRALPREITFGEPSITVHTDAVAPHAEPLPTPPTTTVPTAATLPTTALSPAPSTSAATPTAAATSDAAPAPDVVPEPAPARTEP